MFRIILFLFPLIKILTYNNAKFQQYVKISNIPYLGEYMPYRFQFSSDGNITISLPRVYENYDSAIEQEYSTNPAFLMLGKNNSSPQKLDNLGKIYSVMGFSMDRNNKLYILDQGIIISSRHKVIDNSSKIVMYTLNQTENKTYNFDGINLTNSLLTDIAVEHSGAYAYIVDSGNLNNKDSIPGIIVVNLENKNNNKVYKILNNHISFKPPKDENKLNTNKKQRILDYFQNAIGVNCIQISCNDETIYYSSIKNTKIFSVSTSEIKKAIKIYQI